MKTVRVRNLSLRDLDGIQRINREFPWIAQHAEYVFWLFATIYRQRSFVAVDESDQPCGYVLSAPGSTQGVEFIVQMAVLPEWRGANTARALLMHHWDWMVGHRVQRVQASIHRDCRHGFALLHLARRCGQQYRKADWPLMPKEDHPLALEELLFEAEVKSLPPQAEMQ